MDFNDFAWQLRRTVDNTVYLFLQKQQYVL